MSQHDRRPPGRPRQNINGAGDGNPILGIRMPPGLKSRVDALGGSTWVRNQIERFAPEEDEDLDQPVDPEVIDLPAGETFLCHQCKQLKRYGVKVFVTDKKTGHIEQDFCKACVANWAAMLPGEDKLSKPIGVPD
jgi:hypothetical protein